MKIYQNIWAVDLLQKEIDCIKRTLVHRFHINPSLQIDNTEGKSGMIVEEHP